MIKLFAILTVLAVLPVSALAEMVSTQNKAGIHCMKDQPDVAYVQAPEAVAAAAVSNAGNAGIAR